MEFSNFECQTQTPFEKKSALVFFEKLQFFRKNYFSVFEFEHTKQRDFQRGQENGIKPIVNFLSENN